MAENRLYYEGEIKRPDAIMRFPRGFKLPKNWPVIAAGVWLLMSIFYFVYSTIDIVENPHSSSDLFFYPLFRFYQDTSFLFILLSLGGYLCLLLLAWGQDAREANLSRLLIFLVLLIPLVVCWLVPPQGTVIFGAAVVLITLIPIIRIPRRALTLGFLFVATIASLRSYNRDEVVSHIDSARFDGLTYQLALFKPTFSEIGYCVSYFVYQCELNGLLCQPFRSLPELHDCMELGEEPLDARMVIDPSDNKLYVVQGDKKVSVVPWSFVSYPGSPAHQRYSHKPSASS
jgi:hypothetical protein